MKIFCLLLPLLLALSIHSQVIGIDLGTEFWKASLISPGKNLIIVENTRSNRKSQNGIAFLDGIRHFEYDALQKYLKKPKSAYFYLNKLIRSLDNETPLPGYEFQDGTYYFKQGDEKISLEQLVGMILKNVKIYSSHQAGSDIKDAVLTVPADWGFKSRMALVNAAYLADLSVLGLINENSAAAIHYGISRNDTDPINVVFFNLGSHNLQISILQFYGVLDEAKNKNIESIRALSHVIESDVGGLRVDRQLADYINEEFKAKHKVDIKSNERAYVKLLHKCADLKETLSANKEASVFIQGLIDGIDLNTNVKREVIERLPIFKQIEQNLQKSLDSAGLSKSDIHSVELIGGASRIPLVNKIVKEFFDPVEVGAHINGDQAMAFGSALRAANLSIAFRIKQLHFYDGLPLETKAVISTVQDGVISQSVLFDKNSEHGLKKEIVVAENQENLKVTIYYGEQIIHQYVVENLGLWKEKYDASKYNFTEAPQTVLTFVCHTVTIAELKEAYVNITLNTTSLKQVVEYVEEPINATEQAKQQEKESEKVEQEPKPEQTQNKTEQKAENSDSQTQNAEKSENEQLKKTEKKKKKVKQTKTKKVTSFVQEFKIESKKSIAKIEQVFCKYKKFTKKQIQDKKALILKYQEQQNQIKQLAKVRNDFQSTLYRLKQDFDHPGLKQFSSETQLQDLKKVVFDELEWMDENAWTAAKKEIEKHFNDVYKIYEPILNRSQEYRDREKIYNQTIEILSLTYQKTSQLNESQEWVSQKAIDHLKKLNETVEWIHSKLKEQIKLPLNVNPNFYNHEMIRKAQELRDQYYLIKMIPRPKIRKEKPAEQKPKESDETIDLDDAKPNEPNDSEKPEANESANEQSNDETVRQDL